MGLQKNVAGQPWYVFAFEDGGGTTPGAPVTGDAANITAKLSKDEGALGATNDVNPTELESGFYRFDLTQAETNADRLLLVPVSATANVQVVAVPGTVFTVAANFNLLSIDGSGLVNITQAAADKVWSTTTRTLTALGNSLVDEIWDRATSALSTAGSIGKLLVDNIDAVLSAIETDTQDIQNRLPSALVGGRMDSDIGAINASAGAAITLQKWLQSFTNGTVSGTPTATVFATDLTETTINHYKHLIVSFRSGVLQGQGRRVTAYDGAGEITVTPAFTEAPGVGDAFVLVPLIISELDSNGRTDVGSWLGTAVTLSGGVPDVNIKSEDDIDFGATKKASLNTEVDNALDTAIPGSPTADSINERIAAIDDLTQASGSGDLAAVKTEADKIDAARGEPGQEAPGVSISPLKKLDFLYKWTRNKKDNDGATTQFYADDGSTVDQKQTTSEATGTVTKGEIASGP